MEFHENLMGFHGNFQWDLNWEINGISPKWLDGCEWKSRSK